jgi:GNAT superfamily N-acetyltransferase
MEIRSVTPDDDLLAVSNIYERSWKYAYQGMIPQAYLDSIPKGRWAGSIGKNGMHSLVMLEHGTMIGTASYCRSRWAEYPNHGEIVSLYFLPEYIGKGYGTPLFLRCIEELHNLGYSRILLWVLEENARARRFYERNGFVCAEKYLEDVIGGKSIREVLYVMRQEP